MSKIPVSFHVDDVSVLARSLRKQLQNAESFPGHVEMMNLLAKAGGYKNYQHLKATQEPVAAVEAIKVDEKRVSKAARHFDLDGKLLRWPKKHNMRLLCLWVLWSRLPAREAMSELDLNERLSLEHSFCDHALLRRWMVDHEMVSRKPDGREYRRIEAQPPAEAIALIKAIPHR